MEQEEFLFYGICFDKYEVPKTSEAYKEVLLYDGNDFVNHYLEDIFGNFRFGYHKPSKKCFLSLNGIYGESVAEDYYQFIENIKNGTYEKELNKIQIFFGLNKEINWYYLI